MKARQGQLTTSTQDQLPFYRIGVDVGGTNTDAVLFNHNAPVGLPAKRVNTDDTAADILHVVNEVLRTSEVGPDQIQYVGIGTTVFINALVSRDARLDKVFTVRIGAPCADAVAPYEDWFLTDDPWLPHELINAINAGYEIIEGGYEITGPVIIPLDTAKLEAIARRTLPGGDLAHVKTIAISGMNSTKYPNQEIQARDIMCKINTELKVTLSHQVLDADLLSRENAAILNCALMSLHQDFCKKIREGLADTFPPEVEFYLTRYDGTSEPIRETLSDVFPVLTAGSGPINSLVGGATITQLEDAMQVDAGGTTMEFGATKDGKPLSVTKQHDIACVPMYMRKPVTVSVQLGGGTEIDITKYDEQYSKDRFAKLSIGNNIVKKGMCFVGDVEGAVVTFTCIALKVLPNLNIQGADKSNLDGLDAEACRLSYERIMRMIAKDIHKQWLMLAHKPRHVVLVGGAAQLCNQELLQKALSTCFDESEIAQSEKIKLKVVIPENSFVGVANAIGAAKVSVSCTRKICLEMPDFVTDEQSTDIEKRDAFLDQQAEHLLVSALDGLKLKGGDASKGVYNQKPSRTHIPYSNLMILRCEVSSPIISKHQRLEPKPSITSVLSHTELLQEFPSVAVDDRIKMASELSVHRFEYTDAKEQKTSEERRQKLRRHIQLQLKNIDDNNPPCRLYLHHGDDHINQLDKRRLCRIADGADVLGSGGGGPAKMGYRMLHTSLRVDKKLEIAELDWLDDDATAIGLMMFGNGAAASEKIGARHGGRLVIEQMEREIGRRIDAIVPPEFAGFNAMVPLWVGAELGLPVMNCCGAGRAWPSINYFTFSVMGQAYYEKEAPFNYIAVVSDGFRVATLRCKTLSEFNAEITEIVQKMGNSVIVALLPMYGHQVKKWCIPGAITIAEKIGQSLEKGRYSIHDNPLAPLDKLIRFTLTDYLPKDNNIIFCTGVVAEAPDTVQVKGDYTANGKIIITETLSDTDTQGYGRSPRIPKQYHLAYKNETLFLHEYHKVETEEKGKMKGVLGKELHSAPDLIIIINRHGNRAVPVECVDYGMQVSIIKLKAPKKLYTSEMQHVIARQLFSVSAELTPKKPRSHHGELGSLELSPNTSSSSSESNSLFNSPRHRLAFLGHSQPNKPRASSHPEERKNIVRKTSKRLSAPIQRKEPVFRSADGEICDNYKQNLAN